MWWVEGKEKDKKLVMVAGLPRWSLSRFKDTIQRIRRLPPRQVMEKIVQRVVSETRTVVEELQARLGLAGFTKVDWPSVLVDGLTAETLPDHLRRRTIPASLVDWSRKEATVALIRRMAPDTQGRTVAEAERVCNHTYDLLGSGPTFLGERIDWHRDFISGFRWNPATYFRRIHPAPFPGGYDIKVPWELSRCQHLTCLGQAYWLTGEERFAQEFVSQVSDWIDQNSPLFGVNWACTMDVAIRACNWLLGWSFFQRSPLLSDEFILKLFESLLVHGRFILANLEVGGVVANHYLSDLVGLIYLGLLVPEFRESASWKDMGLTALVAEMDRQVHPDGTDFEASIGYHRLALELFLFPTILCHLDGISFPRPFMERLERMLEFVLNYTKPDGTAPMTGDADDGRLHKLYWSRSPTDLLDHRYLLALGGVLFGRSDFLEAAGPRVEEEALWIFGSSLPAPLKHDGRPPAMCSKAFPDGGIYIMRHQDLYMAIDVGCNGQHGNGGHAHNDTLSFELYAYGTTFLVDPGTYVYTSDYQERNRFRSTAYHNTVVVDGLEMNQIDPARPFSMYNDAYPLVHRWEVTDVHDFFDGEHTGYHRLSRAITHWRRIYFDKVRSFWIIDDLVLGQDEHVLELFFHLAPLLVLADLCGPLTFCASSPGRASLHLIPLDREGLTAELTDGWVSYSYGTRVKAPVIRFKKVASLPTRFVTLAACTLGPHRESKEIVDAARSSVTTSAFFPGLIVLGTISRSIAACGVERQ